MIQKKLYLPFFIVLASIISIFALMSWHHYPMLDGDPVAFLPYAINYAKEGFLYNPLWSSPRVVDPENPTILTWHGFLYPMTLGWLMPANSYSGIRSVITLLWSSSLILFAFVIYQFLKTKDYDKTWHLVLAIGALLGTSGLMPNGGRPELLVAFFVIVSIAGLICTEIKWHSLVLGVTVGLISATSPVSALLYAPIVGIYACTRMPFQKAAMFLVLSALAAGVALCILLIFYPFSFEYWLEGMRLHSQSVVLSDWSGGWREAIRVQPSIIPLLILLFLSLVLGVYVILKRRSNIEFWQGALFFAAILVGGVYYFWLRAEDRSYNVFAFNQIIILWVFCSSIWILETSQNKSNWNKTLVHTVLCVCFLIASVDFIRRILVLPFFFQHGLKYNEARHSLQEMVLMYDDIEISSGLFTLTEEYSHTQVSNSRHTSKSKYFMRQQTYTGDVIPAEIQGYKLIKNNFSPVVPNYFGIKIASSCGAYNYALYRRNDP